MQMRKGFNRESYLNLCLLAAKLYGQQLGNAFKSIDKMKCNPLVVASLLPFFAATATATAFMYLQTALSFV